MKVIPTPLTQDYTQSTADMTVLDLICSGKASVKHRAERATVFINVDAKHETQEASTSRVIEASNSIMNGLNFNKIYKEGVESSHLQRLKTYSSEYRQSSYGEFKTEHHASTSITVNFNDLETMSKAVSQFASMDFVHIYSITYSLRKETRTRLEVELRKLAIHNAIDIARVYFQAASVQKFQMVELFDTHAEDSGSNNTTRGHGMQLFGASTAETPVLNFEPEDVNILVKVNVKFQAEAPTLH